MKPAMRYLLTGGSVLACIVLLVFLNQENSRRRSLLTCQDIKVEIKDSVAGSFVSADDVKGYILEDDGPWKGKRVDSIKLWKIEEILSNKAAIFGSEAYMSDDGILHIEITQRRPVARFHGKNTSFYADASGYIFPIRKRCSARLPIVDGDLPVKENLDYKGEIRDPKARRWMKSLIAMLKYVEESKVWKDAIVQITASSDGSLTLVLSEGKEKFIFGQPDRFKEKFSRIEKYFSHIASRENGKQYSTVNVRYKGQIICR